MQQFIHYIYRNSIWIKNLVTIYGWDKLIPSEIESGNFKFAEIIIKDEKLCNKSNYGTINERHLCARWQYDRKGFCGNDQLTLKGILVSRLKECSFIEYPSVLTRVSYFTGSYWTPVSNSINLKFNQ